jgi:hypothetical protein
MDLSIEHLRGTTSSRRCCQYGRQRRYRAKLRVLAGEVFTGGNWARIEAVEAVTKDLLVRDKKAAVDRGEASGINTGLRDGGPRFR